MAANARCAYCKKPATSTVRFGPDSIRLDACALHKAMAERKNLYMPCIINADLDVMTPEEQARMYRETRWADNITQAEWPVVLRHDGVKAYVRSKLKKKAVGWLMALSRIVYLNRELGMQVLHAADALYREQLKEPPPIPWATLADMIATGWDGDQIGRWLQPLGKLASFDAAGLASLSAALAESEKYESWSLDGNEETA